MYPVDFCYYYVIILLKYHYAEKNKKYIRRVKFNAPPP